MDEPGKTFYDEHRRANRVPWEHPVRLTHPLQVPGRSVNASAVGLLVRVEQGYDLRKGDVVAFEIPNEEAPGMLIRRGRIVRIEYDHDEMLLGVDLL
jgi:hypothetical protein